MPANARRPRMSNAAYAGFLRLLLTPLDQTPKMCPEIEAYLRWVNLVTRDNPQAAA